MVKGVQVEATAGALVHKQVVTELGERLAEEAEKTQTKQAGMLLAVGESILDNLVAAHSVIYGRGLHERLNLKQPLISICWDAAALLHKGIPPSDGDVLAAQRNYEAVARLLAEMIAPRPDLRRLLKTAIDFGKAQVLMMHAATGLWIIMAQAGANAEIAGKVSDARSAGGATTGRMMQAMAQEWKAAALAAAQQIDAEHPNWTRSRIATELSHLFHGRRDVKLPGLRALEEWLEKEAEHPHGPLRSRARKSLATNAVS